MKFKVMQFNIRTGFRKEKKPFQYEGRRINYAKRIIKREKPDILILNEAYFETINENNILMDYQKIFKFPYYAHGNWKNGLNPNWGTALLSKYPIIKIVNNNKGLRGFFISKIKIKDKILNIVITHITPIPYLSNIGQKKAIKEILKNRTENFILAGDFNSLSPEDHYDEEKMNESWSKISEKPKDVVKEMLKRDAIKEVLANGLIDTYKAKNKKFDYTIPTDYLSKNKSTGIRIDYIFCSKELKILKSGIIKNKLSEKASDHYPIYAILEI